MLPYLADLPDGPDRQYAAERIYGAVHSHKAENVGVIARLRVKQSDLHHRPDLKLSADRLHDALERARHARRERLAQMTLARAQVRGASRVADAAPERDPYDPAVHAAAVSQSEAVVHGADSGRVPLHLILLGALAFFAAFYGCTCSGERACSPAIT